MFGPPSRLSIVLMNTLSQLTKTTTKTKKRVGRGYGSGAGGHTCGRGAKGDKARGKTKLTFDGSKIKKSWIKRTPFLRGKHRLLSQKDIISFNLNQLDGWFKDKDIVSLKTLAQAAKIPLKELKSNKVKILSNGKITKALKIKQISLSLSAKNKIVKAGGSHN